MFGFVSQLQYRVAGNELLGGEVEMRGFLTVLGDLKPGNPDPQVPSKQDIL